MSKEKWMELTLQEEKSILEEYQDILIENKLDKQDNKIKNDLEAKNKAKQTFQELKRLGNELVSIKDEDLVEDRFILRFSKFITRCIVIIIATTTAFFIGNALIAFITFVITKSTLKFAQRNIEVKQRRRLIDMYENKIDYINNKIDQISSDDPKRAEKIYDLNKMKKTFQNNLRKLNVVTTREDD